MIVDLDLDVNPVPLARPRVVHGDNGPRTFTPRRSADFVDAFRWACAGAGWRGASREPLTDPIALEVKFWRRHRGNNRGDLDNMVKAVLDAGNGFLWVDDRQVVKITAELWGSGPSIDGRIHLRVEAPYLTSAEIIDRLSEGA